VSGLSQYKKIAGIAVLLLVLCVITSVLSDRFLIAANLENLIRRISLFGILGIGVTFVIITSGIDLSIGSMVCLIGTLLPLLIVKQGWPAVLGVGALLLLAALLGGFHGVLITRLKLQPFIVTLCGLLLYRGIARGVTGDQTQGFGVGYDALRAFSIAKIPLAGLQVPASFFVMIILAVICSLVLRFTVYGRYLYAVGRNELAVTYSGINAGKVIAGSYIICAFFAGVGGVLFILDINSAQPSDFGNFYELYAIAAAVLGGCSLRGGEGGILGVLLGTAIIQVLRNMIILLDIPTQLEFSIIGGVILAGVVVEEAVRRLRHAA
jgi:ribose transport system permease protein